MTAMVDVRLIDPGPARIHHGEREARRMNETAGSIRGSRGPRIITTVTLAAAALALAAAPAQARAPRITPPPHIEGTAQVGQTLTEQGAEYTGGPDTTVT